MSHTLNLLIKVLWNEVRAGDMNFLKDLKKYLGNLFAQCIWAKWLSKLVITIWSHNISFFFHKRKISLLSEQRAVCEGNEPTVDQEAKVLWHWIMLFNPEQGWVPQGDILKDHCLERSEAWLLYPCYWIRD